MKVPNPHDDVEFLSWLKHWQTTLQETGQSAIDQDGLTGKHVKIKASEKKDLQLALRNLYSIDELVKTIQKLPYQHERAHAFFCLCGAIGASFAIGSHASVSETQRFFQLSSAQSKRGKAQRKKTKKQTQIDRLILACRRRKHNANSAAIRNWILSHWNDFDETSDAPDPSTVNRYLKKLS